MDRFLRMNAAGMGMGQSAAPTDAPVVDTAEQVMKDSLDNYWTVIYRCSR
jgi:hypothetical protein